MSLTLVIPCLNEEGSIVSCIEKARIALGSVDASVEILVVDNGSTDRSRELAEKSGARVVSESVRGYGSALMRGLKEAKGTFILMGDADNTYDFEDGAKLVQLLKDGADFAIGDRINGQVEKGAMPWLHQHLGTPVLTWVLNQFFGSRVHDINCGLRAIRKDCVERIRLRSPGMEFASEMVINAQRAGLKFAEAPIRYYCRREGQAKLRTFRDGWRHLRFTLLCAPFPVFFVPSLLLVMVGSYLLASSRLGFQVLGGGLTLMALQIFIFGFLAKAVLWTSDSFLVDRPFGSFIQKFRLEWGILVSLVLILLGAIEISEIEIGGLIRGAWLFAFALQVFFSSFLLSMILMRKRETI